MEGKSGKVKTIVGGDFKDWGKGWRSERGR